MQSLLRQRGVALIMVLGLMAIISILATQIIDQVHSSTQKSTSLKDLQQAYWFARGGESYAQNKLNELMNKPILKSSDLQVHLPIQQGQISYLLTPLHACMNLNSLNREKKDDPETFSFMQKTWKWFLEHQAQLDISNQEMLLNRVKDWTDNDMLPSGVYGAEATFYTGQTPAQQPPNRDMISTSELNNLELFDKKTYDAISAFTCARPGDHQLNINPNDLNTDSSYLISALLHDQIDQPTSMAVIQEKPSAGYETLEAFWQSPYFSGLDITEQAKASLTLHRYYFLLKTEVRLKRTRFTLISLLHIDDKKITRVLGRRYGVSP